MVNILSVSLAPSLIVKNSLNSLTLIYYAHLAASHVIIHLVASDILKMS